jgi:hypothetical protein
MEKTMMATDAQSIDFLISVAEIAGVFVGFGVLIGAIQRSDEVAPERKALAQGIAIIGLTAMLTALLPPTLREFGLSGQALWFYASIGFFVIIYVAFAAALGQRDFREFNIVNFKKSPLWASIFWIGLEAPIQLALLMIIFDLLPGMEHALYVFAVILSVAEAAMCLTLLVFHREAAAGS